ncbi:hypothetical protein BDZ88DRAFT_404483 [Geranomyces variabilis]|nr:hypothetical protein BDZ88DRAFT_404483 [Geranomyces variabilis]
MTASELDDSTLQQILAAAGAGDDQFFAVTPRTDCPHVSTNVQVPTVAITTPCRKCGDASENWLCIVCHGVFCSRYVKSDMSAHAEEEADHCVAVSFSDLSTWCFKCNDYIDNPVLQPLRSFLHERKFGEPMPAPRGLKLDATHAPSGSDSKGKGRQL